MKILQISARIPFPLNDGGAISTYNTTKYLQRAGHSVTFLSLNTNKHFQPISVMADICDEIQAVNINTDVKAWDALTSLFDTIPYNLQRFISREFALMIENTLQSQIFDAIHLDSLYTAYYVESIRKHTSVPIILRAQNVEWVIWNRLWQNELNPFKKWYFRHLAKQIYHYESERFGKLDGILAITPEDFSRIREMGYRGNMRAVPLGVDFEMFTPLPKISTKTNTLFFFGSLDWMPNIEAVHWLMREVYPLLSKQFPSVELHIGGKNPSAEILNYGKRNNVFVHANVPFAPEFMQKFDIMLVPLLSGGGMRVKIVEAMGMEKAIISTRVGAEGISVKDGEDILFAETPVEFLASIEKLLADTKLKSSIAKNARETALRLYHWNNLGSEMVDFYGECIASKKKLG